eukprot:5809359-Prymnesium_polylepis.1
MARDTHKHTHSINTLSSATNRTLVLQKCRRTPHFCPSIRVCPATTTPIRRPYPPVPSAGITSSPSSANRRSACRCNSQSWKSPPPLKYARASIQP